MIDFAGDARGRELRLLVERAKHERHVLGLVDALLDREFNRVVDLILSPKFRTLTPNQRQRALQLFREIERRLGVGYRDVVTLVTREMQGLAVLEADIARVQATSILGAAGGELTISLGPSLPKAYLSTIARLPIQGLSIGEWFDGQARKMSLETRRIIQQGLVEGKGPAEIARRIVADQRTPGAVLSRRAKNEARIIARTTVNAVQNDAALASYARLPASVSDSYRWLSVKDARTSVVCAALADRVFRYDDPKRRIPPAHPNCRSSIQPLLRGGDLTLAEQKDAPMTMQSYSAWLKGQTATTQNEILGVGRADLWRRGRMQLADAIDADARVLTLKELRATIGVPITAK